jgi:biopolymer transport protein ExbB
LPLVLLAAAAPGLFSAFAGAQEVAPVAPAPPPAAEAAPAAVEPAPGAGTVSEFTRIPPTEELTLMVMIQQGGVILWVIMALGFVAVVWTVYLLATVTTRREVPLNLGKRAQAQVRAGDIRGAYQMCLERDELLANVLRAGLKMSGHDRYVIQEAMESEGERGATALWQRISYLHNIAMIAPLLGLLGTVWGMMQAFSAIAFDSAQVKGLTMAYSVSMAMITTAGGLVLAIPALGVYYFLRGRVVKIIAAVEAQASEFVELLSGGPQE